MKTLVDMLANRNPRERQLLALMGGLFLIWAGIALVWQPLRAKNAGLEASIQRTDQWLQRLSRLPSPTQGSTKTISDSEPLSTLITTTGDDFGLSVRRLQPQGNTVQAVLEDAPFDAVLLWIAAMEQDHAVQLVDLTLTRRPAAGSVAATLTVGH